MRLVIRVDAGARLGTGHVMRCLALAQELHVCGGQACFVVASAPEALLSRLSAEGMVTERVMAVAGSMEDAKQTARIAREFDAEWIVVDGYHFDGGYQRIIKLGCFALLVVDDFGRILCDEADVILNQNPYANVGQYKSQSTSPRLLLGPRYALLRNEFRLWRNWQREFPRRGRHLLVTLGGSDPNNVTLKVVEALKLIKHSKVKSRILIGPANPNHEQVRQALTQTGDQIDILEAVRDMPAQMAWADLAVTAAGSTCWELAFLGVPMLAIITAHNQEPIAVSLEENGAAVNTGWHHALKAEALAYQMSSLIDASEQRRQLSERGRRLVDGMGSQRVLACLKSITA